jgi:penicillin-binding protein 1A
MPHRGHRIGALIVVALTALSTAALALAPCPARLLTDPIFHLPVAQLEPIASRIVEAIGDKTVFQGKSVEAWQLSTPLAAIPERLRNAFIAAGEAPSRGEIDKIKRRSVDCIEAEVLKLVWAATKGERAPRDGLVPVSLRSITRKVAFKVLSSPDQDVINVNGGMKRLGNEQIIAFLVAQSDKITHDDLLELSLNAVYLGAKSYGVTVAAANYFGKPLDQLTVAEAAYLAGVAHAPNNYHPFRHAERAVERRDLVIDQMREGGFIADAEARTAKAEPLKTLLDK